jgi:hypothetical protein
LGIFLAIIIILSAINNKMNDWHFRDWLCANTEAVICIKLSPNQTPPEVIEERRRIGKAIGKNY